MLRCELLIFFMLVASVQIADVAACELYLRSDLHNDELHQLIEFQGHFVFGALTSQQAIYMRLSDDSTGFRWGITPFNYHKTLGCADFFTFQLAIVGTKLAIAAVCETSSATTKLIYETSSGVTSAGQLVWDGSEQVATDGSGGFGDVIDREIVMFSEGSAPMIIYILGWKIILMRRINGGTTPSWTSSQLPYSMNTNFRAGHRRFDAGLVNGRAMIFMVLDGKTLSRARSTDVYASWPANAEEVKLAATLMEDPKLLVLSGGGYGLQYRGDIDPGVFRIGLIVDNPSNAYDDLLPFPSAGAPPLWHSLVELDNNLIATVQADSMDVLIQVSISESVSVGFKDVKVYVNQFALINPGKWPSLLFHSGRLVGVWRNGDWARANLPNAGTVFTASEPNFSTSLLIRPECTVAVTTLPPTQQPTLMVNTAAPTPQPTPITSNSVPSSKFPSYSETVPQSSGATLEISTSTGSETALFTTVHDGASAGASDTTTSNLNSEETNTPSVMSSSDGFVATSAAGNRITEADSSLLPVIVGVAVGALCCILLIVVILAMRWHSARQFESSRTDVTILRRWDTPHGSAHSRASRQSRVSSRQSRHGAFGGAVDKRSRRSRRRSVMTGLPSHTDGLPRASFSGHSCGATTAVGSGAYRKIPLPPSRTNYSGLPTGTFTNSDEYMELEVTNPRAMYELGDIGMAPTMSNGSIDYGVMPRESQFNKIGAM